MPIAGDSRYEFLADPNKPFALLPIGSIILLSTNKHQALENDSRGGRP